MQKYRVGCYGYFKSDTFIKNILQPFENEKKLILIDTETFLVTAPLQDFEAVIAYKVKENIYTEEYKSYCLEGLKNNGRNLFTFTTELMEDEALLKQIIRTSLKYEHCYILDKTLNCYATQYEFYEIIDHPAPAIGTKKDCYACNGKEFYSYVTARY
jgi:hypothetical protein